MRYELDFHHVGAAVLDIGKTVEKMRESFLDARLISGIVSDPNQNADVALVRAGGLLIELVSGSAVSRFVSEKESGVNFYHVCYQTDEFDKAVSDYSRAAGAILASPPKPAALFDQRRVVFFMVKGMGFVEILERRDR